MNMTPLKLVVFRIFNITLGRFNFFSKLTKKILVRNLAARKRRRYTASANFFTKDQLK